MLYKNTGGGVGYGGKTGGKENKDLVPEIKLIYLGKNVNKYISYQQLFQAPKEVTRKRIKRFILSSDFTYFSIISKENSYFLLFFF